MSALATSSASAADAQWINGTTQWAWGNSCIILGQPTYDKQVGATTGYWGKTDASYPKIGDRYWGHVYYMPTGVGCNFGLHGVQVEIALPEGTQLAINPNSTDPNDKIQCSLTGLNGQERNVTGQGWAHPEKPNINGKYCTPTGVSQGAHGAVMSYALLAQGQALHVWFPLKSTRKMSGMAEPGGNSKMIATVSEPGITTRAFPEQFMFVGDRPVEVDCPDLGQHKTEAITNNSAQAKASMCNWYRSGNAQFEIREGTAGAFVPQAAGQQIAVDGQFQGYHLNQNWVGLKPGTEYQWRLKFTDSKGATQLGPVQTFKTTGTPPTNGGGGIPQPGSGGSDGAGEDPDAGGETPGDPTDPKDPKPNDPKTPPKTPEGPKVPDQPKPPRDIQAPSFSASGGTARKALKKGVKIKANCSEACSVNAQLRINAKTAKKLKLGKKAIVIGKGGGLSSKAGKLTISVKLNAKGRKALKRARSVKASVTLRATDHAGNAAPATTKKVTLKR